MGRAAKGRSIANLLEFKPGEEIAAVMRIQSKLGAGKDETWDENQHILFTTKTGVIKRATFPLTATSARGHHRDQYRGR